MKLFIRIKNGQPFEHPILESNFIEVFPDIDITNLPPEFAEFVRVNAPILGVYEKNQTCSYQFIDNIWTDVFTCEQMTEEEKIVKQEQVKNSWINRPDYSNFTTWVFNEEQCFYEAPIPYPNDGKNYFWQGTTNSWVEYPLYPTDGKNYKLDVATGTWIELS